MSEPLNMSVSSSSSVDISSNPSVHRGDILLLSKKRTWRQTLEAHLPDPISRIALVVALCGALAVSIVWLYYIINSRWLEQARNPTAVLTIERMLQIPPMEGIAITFPANQFGTYSGQDTSAVFTYIEAKMDHTNLNSTSGLISTDEFQCAQYSLFPSDAICEPYVNGLPIFGPTNGPGAQPNTLTIDDWPIKFLNRGDDFGIAVHLLFNESRAVEGKPDLDFVIPINTAYLLPGKKLVDLKNLQQRRNNGDVPSTAEMFQFLDGTAYPLFLRFNQANSLEVGLSKKVDVHGVTTLEWTVKNGNYLQLSRGQIEGYWQRLLAKQTPEMQTAMQALRAQPNITYYINLILLTPSSFDIQVITEKNMYGIIPFLGDLGGFLNLLALSLAVLFPFSHAFIRQRSFIVLNVWHKLFPNKNEEIWREHMRKEELQEMEEMKAQEAAESEAAAHTKHRKTLTNGESHHQAAPVVVPAAADQHSSEAQTELSEIRTQSTSSAGL